MKLLAGYLLPLLLTAKMSGPPPEYFAGGTFGVVDSLGRHVIPSQFSKIEYLGHGLYQTTGIDPPDKYSFGKEHVLYDREGHLLNLKLPPECTFERVFWLGKLAEGKGEQRFDDLPADALLQIKKGDKFGICDVQGAVVVPPEYAKMEKPGDGLSIVSKDSIVISTGKNDRFVFNVEDHSLMSVDATAVLSWRDTYSEGRHPFSARNGKLGYLGSNGQIAIPAQYDQVTAFLNGVAIVSIRGEGLSWQRHQIDTKGKAIWDVPPSVGRKVASGKAVTENRVVRTTLVSQPFPVLASTEVVLKRSENDRFIAHSLPEKKNFDSVKWKDNHWKQLNRESQFTEFLMDYDFIGMSRRQVCDLLGDGKEMIGGKELRDPLYYVVVSGSCGTGSRFIQVDFDSEDKVDHYCFNNDDKAEAPIKVNVFRLQPK